MKITSPLGPIVISVLVTGGFLCTILLLLMVKHDFAQTAGQALLILTGILSQSFGTVVNYWLGSSAGSAGKTDQIAAIAAAK